MKRATTPTHAAPLYDAVAAFRARLPGLVLTRGDDGYDAARSGFDLAQTPNPDVVVLPRDVEDVQVAVATARDLDLRLRVGLHGPLTETGARRGHGSPYGDLRSSLGGCRREPCAGASAAVR